jgi:hypothetical protein
MKQTTLPVSRMFQVVWQTRCLPRFSGTEQLTATIMPDAHSGDVELEHTRPARPFEGLTICFTAVASDVKVGLIKKLNSMGVSKVEGNLTMDTSALISESFDSVKYQVGIRSNANGRTLFDSSDHLIRPP